MPEEMEVGIDRVQDDIAELHQELAEAKEERAKERRPQWIDYLAISTALFAVLAALAALEAGNYANEALFKANKGVLQQARATDTWSEYQADSIKKYEQQNLVVLLRHTGGTPVEMRTALTEAARRQRLQNTLQAQARELERTTEELNKDAERDLEHHHRFAISVTLFQVAIGLSAIAALLRMRALWLTSLGGGAIAVLLLVDGFVLFR